MRPRTSPHRSKSKATDTPMRCCGVPVYEMPAPSSTAPADEQRMSATYLAQPGPIGQDGLSEMRPRPRASQCSPGAHLAAIAQRADEEGEGGRRLATARVIKVVARIGQAPVLKHAPEAAPREVRFRHAFRHIGQAQSGQGRR